jgi:hypothetical protein
MFRRRPSLIESIAAAQVNMIRTAMGGPVAPPEPKKDPWWKPTARKCLTSIVWPTIQGGWIRWDCPGPLRHKGLHWDENYYPGYHDEDIYFFQRQYDLLFGEDQ